MTPDQIILAIAAAYQAYQALRAMGIAKIGDDETLTPEQKAQYIRRIAEAQGLVPEWK